MAQWQNACLIWVKPWAAALDSQEKNKMKKSQKQNNNNNKKKPPQAKTPKNQKQNQSETTPTEAARMTASEAKLRECD